MHINELFEKQANSNPFATAVVCLDQRITYQALDKKANQFAHYLKSNFKVKSGDVIGLSVERKDINLVVVMLSILKLGAAYRPLSVVCDLVSAAESPKSQHITCIIGDNHQTVYNNYIPISQIENLSKNHSEQPIVSTIKSEYSIAYLISTSGTTGYPKTIAISHDNLIATFRSWQLIYQLEAQDRHLQMANFSFDVFTGDWVRALCSGGTLVMCPKNHLLHPEWLFSLIEKNQITIAEFVPAVLRKLMAYLEKNQKKLSTFRLLICGSDIWYVSECKKLKQLCGQKTRIINSYGLAETTIDATYFEYSEESCAHLREESIVPVGKAFPHALVKVITSTGQCAQIGEKGEIYIGGQGVSKYGYLDNPGLTEKKFVMLKDSKHVFYKTGDIGEILQTNDILFLGRNENQFNVNGQRVDFLSVESVLLQHPNVKSAVLIPNFSSDMNFLEAFLVLNGGIDYKELMDYLKNKLPVFAIPRYFYEVEAIILSNNDKIIREKNRQKIVRRIAGNFVAPATRAQKVIAHIWEKTLRQKQISINDRFDLLGGTSLDYINIISEINDIFHANISLCGKLNTIVEMAMEINYTCSSDALTPCQYQQEG